MQNIWVWVVGALVAIGAGATIVKMIDGGPDRTARAPVAPVTAPAPAPAASGQPGNAASTEAVTVPKPDGSIADMKITAEDFSLGKADAPVTIIEYASLTCPHCAVFHTNVLPAVKTEFIDTGKARLIYRDYPLDRIALAGSTIARCAGRDRYFGFIGAFFAAQANWARDQNPLAALGRIARIGGMSDVEIDACLKRSDIEEAVLRQRLEGEREFAIRSTPTIFVNGDKYSGGLTVEQIRSVIAGKLNKR